MIRCDCWGPAGRLDTKISQIDSCHIYMSYASYDIKCHIMMNYAYDIEIWHKSIWSSLVSKWPSGPHQSHLFIRFGLTNCLKIKKLKNASEIFSLYKFWKSFVFSGELDVKFGLTFVIARNLFFLQTILKSKSGWE